MLLKRQHEVQQVHGICAFKKAPERFGKWHSWPSMFINKTSLDRMLLLTSFMRWTLLGLYKPGSEFRGCSFQLWQRPGASAISLKSRQDDIFLRFQLTSSVYVRIGFYLIFYELKTLEPNRPQLRISLASAVSSLNWWIHPTANTKLVVMNRLHLGLQFFTFPVTSP